MNIIIISNGQFPSQPKVLELLEQADYIVCCDGALGKFLNWYRTSAAFSPLHFAVVGDGDSSLPVHLQEARQLFPQLQQVTISEQEDNDLTKAVRYVIKAGRGDGVADRAMHIAIIGATGLREDHTLGNISLLAYYGELYPDIDFTLYTDTGIIYPVRGRRRFDSVAGQQVSIFSLTPGTPVSVEGLRYPIHDRCLRWAWEGTLNEALGDSFEVRGGVLLVYLLNSE